MLETVALWATIGGAVLSLMALAWAAVNYVIIRRQEQQRTRYRNLFDLMDELGRPGHSVASKMAAAYELRKYPEYKDVIVRLLEKVEVEGSSAQMLKEEMILTAQALKAST